MNQAKKIYISDVTLRDGSHAIRHQYSVEQARRIARALDEAKVDSIEVAHGDGLQGSSFNYGFGAHTDLEWIEAVASEVKHARIATLLLPGIGTVHDLKNAYDAGVRVVRVATHCTEADVSRQHIEYARHLGMEAVGFLMMSHMTERAGAASQAHGKLRRDLLLRGGLRRRARHAGRAGPLPRLQGCAQARNADRHARASQPEPGRGQFHRRRRGRLRPRGREPGRHGRGRGQRAAGSFIAAIDRMGWNHGTDLYKLMDAADDIVRPLQDRPVRVDRETLALGYAGVYSSFLRHAEAAAAKYQLKTVDILVELGKRRMVGGQEDMIVDVALDILKQRA